jgi:hypothetical protein
MVASLQSPLPFSIREREVSAIIERLLSATGGSIQARVEEVKALVEDGISNLGELRNENAPLAKTVLHRHLDDIRMSPANDGESWHYVAE